MKEDKLDWMGRPKKDATPEEDIDIKNSDISKAARNLTKIVQEAIEGMELGDITVNFNIGVPIAQQATAPNRDAPMIDVIDKEREITVIAEMPGLKAEEIKVSLDAVAGALEIKSENPARSYASNIMLPSRVTEKKMRSNYTNGILEITIAKA